MVQLQDQKEKSVSSTAKETVQSSGMMHVQRAWKLAPAWMQKNRQEAWQQFQKLPMPTRTNEHWRFADLNSLKTEDFSFGKSVDEKTKKQIEEQSVSSFESTASLIFAEDELIAAKGQFAELKKQGVIFAPISEAIKDHGDLIQKYFMKESLALGSEKFETLHAAQMTEGVLVYIPKDVKVEKPLNIYHWMVNENSSMFPHTLIIAEKGSSVIVFDHERSVKDVGGFSCAINDIFVGEDAKVIYVNSQNWSKKATSLKLSECKVEARGYSKSLYLNLGGNYTRLENQVRMIGKESRSEMLGLAVSDEQQEMDLRTLQTHVAAHTWSDLLYKNALNGESRTIFKGMIRVEEGASQTDAYQTNRNLLLSGEAEADSMPGLEILNDDVKCSHGATTGQIEPELLFYLKQRGISKEKAQFMLVHGFFEEVIDRLGHEGIVKELLSHVDAKCV